MKRERLAAGRDGRAGSRGIQTRGEERTGDPGRSERRERRGAGAGAGRVFSPAPGFALTVCRPAGVTAWRNGREPGAEVRLIIPAPQALALRSQAAARRCRTARHVRGTCGWRKCSSLPPRGGGNPYPGCG